MELLSIVLFLAAIAVYSYKAGRNKFWFILILLLLTLFIVLNATLYASNYFTGDGINDAVLYTLTNSLTGAGVSKYVVPALGLILGAAPPQTSASSRLEPAGDRLCCRLGANHAGVSPGERADRLPRAPG